MENTLFYKNKKVLITGNTGFKGTWLTLMMLNMGAEVVGYSLAPPTNPSIYKILNMNKYVKTHINDIRDYDSLYKCFSNEKPEIVFHLAAQPIVREGYKNPLYTYECNVIGTTNILECVRCTDTVKSFLNVTTDKVYKNNEWEWGYRENDVIDGYDPYSNSKSCSELITASYKRSFFEKRDVSISIARAGNVFGGGDFATDRIVPDCCRACENGYDIFVRNPFSVRPYQHVLEPLSAYVLIARKQYESKEFEGSYNVGPDDSDCISTGILVDLFCKYWGKDLSWYTEMNEGPHEAGFLKLDCSLIKNKLKWKPMWNVKTAMEKTVEWQKQYMDNANMNIITEMQIKEYFGGV